MCSKKAVAVLYNNFHARLCLTLTPFPFIDTPICVSSDTIFQLLWPLLSQIMFPLLNLCATEFTTIQFSKSTVKCSISNIVGWRASS